MVHCANSAATVRSSEFHEDMVRCGLAMYGCHPGSGVDALPTGPVVPGGPEFRQAISWRTSIVQVKELPAGYHIGYGNTYTSPSPILVGLLPVGYGNGFRRGPLNPGHVSVAESSNFAMLPTHTRPAPPPLHHRCWCEADCAHCWAA